MIDTILAVVIGVITDAIRLYAVYLFFQMMLGDELDRKIPKLLLLVIGVIWTNLFYWPFHNVWINIIVNLSFYLFLAMGFRATWIKRVFCSLLAYGIVACLEVILILGFEAMQASGIFFQLGGVIDALVLLLGILLLRNRLDVQADGELPGKIYVWISVPVIISILILLILVLHIPYMISVRGAELVGFGLLCLNGMVLASYLHHIEVYRTMQRQGEIVRQIQAYKNQVLILQESNARVREVRHDMKHHVIELRHMLEEKETSAAEAYLNRMEESIRNPQEYASTGNETDGILNYMVQKAKRQEIKVDLELQVPESSPLLNYDTSVILGNLLENAITAAAASEKKWIHCVMRYQQNVLTVLVENSYSGRVNDQGKRFLSTKEEPSGHGLGLESVKRVVREKGGMMDIRYDAELFCVSIMLFT